MAHWKETFKPARFSFIDARAGIPLLLTLLYVRPWTLFLAFSTIALFVFLERRGLSVPSAFRAFRAWIVGDARPPKTIHKVRGIIDYGRREF